MQDETEKESGNSSDDQVRAEPQDEPAEEASEERSEEQKEEEAGSEEAEDEEGSQLALEKLKSKYEDSMKQVKEKMLRIAADFDNYKKRIQREFTDREERAKAEVLKIILPTIDNLHRAVKHSKETNDINAVVDGISIVEKNFIETLAKVGVTRIEAKGNIFDPTFHEAIAQQESQDVPAGMVIDEVQSGYMLNDKLLRAALVVVSSGKPKAEEEEEAERAKEAEDAGEEEPVEEDQGGTDSEEKKETDENLVN